jgi:hypothetical protein
LSFLAKKQVKLVKTGAVFGGYFVKAIAAKKLRVFAAEKNLKNTCKEYRNQLIYGWRREIRQFR